MSAEELETIIRDEFEILGVSPPNNIIKQCVDFCCGYGLTVDEFMGEWIAFSVSQLNDKVEPTRDNLTLFESRSLRNFHKKDNEQKVDSNVTVNVEENDDEDDVVLMNSYYVGSPATKKPKISKRIQSPTIETTSPKKSPTNGESEFKLDEQVSSKYAERGDSGQAVLTFSKKSADNIKFVANDNYMPLIKLCDGHNTLTSDTMYMFNYPIRNRYAAGEITDYVGKAIVEKELLEEPEIFIGFALENVTSYGRICCSENNKLNTSNILVESSSIFADGDRAQLVLKNVKEYSLFPGQTIVMRTKANMNTFLAEQIYTDATLPLPAELPKITNSGPLNILVAAGPYTVNDNMAYQPLQDLINYIIEHTPHIVILIGPFLDADHQMVNDNGMSESFFTYFDKLIDKIMTSLNGLKKTQVILIPSLKDVCHHYVYPTPPYELKKQFENLHLFSDPSVFDVEGLTIGVTSVDVLFHLSKQELSWQVKKADRMTRIISHILSQRSFYPLYPANEEINLDLHLLAQQAILKFTPHILILPSNFKYFVKNIEGCIVINPERITKYSVGGTFAQIQIYPEQIGASVADNIVCQIVKI